MNNDRIFHRRIIASDVVVAVLDAMLALLAFVYHNPARIVVGLGLVVFAVLAVESIVRTTYTVTTDGRLVVYRGRFAKARTYDLTQSSGIGLVGGLIFPPRSVIIAFEESRKHVSLQPENEEEFIDVAAKYIPK